MRHATGGSHSIFFPGNVRELLFFFEQLFRMLVEEEVFFSDVEQAFCPGKGVWEGVKQEKMTR
jgi:hypothetical protein